MPNNWVSGVGIEVAATIDKGPAELDLRQAFDVIRAAVVVTDAELRIIYMNDAARRLFIHATSKLQASLPGFTADTVIGRYLYEIHPEPEPHRKHLLNSQDNLEKLNIDFESVLFEVHVSRTTDENGRLAQMVTEWQDRTLARAEFLTMMQVYADVASGQLSRRMPLDELNGPYKRVAERFNALVDRLQTFFDGSRRFAQAMEAGDLTQRIEIAPGDIGSFAESINRGMQMMQDVLLNIRSAMAPLTLAADEINSGNDNLNSRTQQQAAAIEEIAGTVEELTSTVRQNAENAGSAVDLALMAQNTAERGGQVVKRAIAAMDEIHASSQRISDIIIVIDEIAFQTNLLALNAAVEAARAGEQGRGFAVVAAEIRDLAQRTAEAAKEIKNLIRDSVEKVEDGTRLADRSGEALDDIKVGVKRVRDIIHEIAAASDEQALGVEQVNHAIGHMDETTQQNAALVEEAAAATASMTHEMLGVEKALEVFHVGDIKIPPRAIQDTPQFGASSDAPRLPPLVGGKAVPRPVSKRMTERPTLIPSPSDWEEF